MPVGLKGFQKGNQINKGRKPAFSPFIKGHKINLGRKLSKKTKRKRKPSPRKGIKTGKPAWNRGMKMSDEFCKKVSIAHKGQ